MEEEVIDEDLEVESEVEEESDDDASSPALSAASTPPYSEEGFFPPSSKSGKLFSARRGRGRPRKDIDKDKKAIGMKLKRWRSNIYVKGEASRTPSSDILSPWGGKSPAESPIHPLTEMDIEKPFPMSAPDDPPFFTEAWPGKLCALCGLSERSMLGQREMIRLSCPDGFPSKPLAISTTSGDKSPRGIIPTAPSIRRQRQGKSVAELLDELSLVGYVDDPDITTIVEPAGTFYVHLSCIVWAAGVTRTGDGDQNIEGAWSAVEIALTRRCAHCSRLGAATVCSFTQNGETCGQSFHFPCAVAAAGFLDPQTRSLICSKHHEKVTMLPVAERIQCGSCHSLGNVANLVMCSTCETHYHGFCVGISLQPAVRAGWQCCDCRTCQVCRQPSEIGKVMICETCEKSYHPSCLRPIVTSIPKYGWKCKCCRVCSDCGSRTPGSGLSSRWHNHFSVCDSCYQQRNKGFCCPICGRAYRAAAYRDMVKCTKCCKFVHGTCDPDADLLVYTARKEASPDYDYVCSVCKVTGGRPFAKRKDSLDDGTLEGLSNSQDIFDDLDGDFSQFEKEGGQGMGKGKQFALNSAKKRFGIAIRSKVNYQKMKVPDIAKKRGMKTKMRGVFGVPGLGLQRPQAEPGGKVDDEPGVENRMVLCSGSDKFVTSQDMCVMCGALGTDQEGCLMACVQCGQCYHPYCVNVKVTKVILTKGWRCLDCTVCEGCGQRNDDARLTLCDDCDISYHIYCMDPPLESVPRGVWKCKWCVVCTRCGSQEPGVNCSWMNKYTECGPCASHTACPLCCEPYNENELVIQCETCNRWLHGACDSIRNENEAEECAGAPGGYSCAICRPRDMPPPHLNTNPVINEQINIFDHEMIRPSQTQFFLDGVCLSEAGMNHIKALSLERDPIQRKKPRAKRFPPLLPPTCEKEARMFATIESVVSAGQEGEGEEEIVKEYREGMEVQRGEDGKPPEPPEGFNIFQTESGALVLRRKRTRNLQKLGIGGFLVRVRTVRKEEDPDGDKSETSYLEKPKRKPIRRKPRSKLAESYPPYLQEAFFGKELLDLPKEKNVDSSSESDRDEGLKVTHDKTIELSKDELKAYENVKAKHEKEQSLKTEVSSPIKEEDEGSDSEVLKDLNLKDLPLPGDLLDNDLVDTIMAEEGDIKPNVDEGGLVGDSGGSSHNKVEISDILSPHFNLEGLPDMGKDVEEIFKVVMTDENQTGPNVEINVQTALASPVTMPLPSPAVLPSSFPPPSPYHSEYSNSPHSQASEPPSPWHDEPPLSVEPPTPNPQRSTPQKMEADEALGHQATISSVLYANTNHPEWKTLFPAWSERYKQILKKWRNLSNDQKAPYLQSARDNRSALRMKKAQQIPKESPTASTPPLLPLKTASVGSGPDGAVPATSASASVAEVCEEASIATAREQLTPSTNPPSPSPDPDDRAQVESSSQTEELGLKGQDQDKSLQQQKNSRESDQERAWKHMQASRQHEQRMQAMARSNRPIGDESNPTLTSQLQIATNQETHGISAIPPPSPGGRPQFPANSSVKVTRLQPGQNPSPFTTPMMPRVMRPPMHSPLQSPMQSPLQSPLAEHVSPDEGFVPRFAANRATTPFSPRPENYDPEVTRQLRELLQRQKDGTAVQRPWLNPGESGFNEAQETFRQPLPVRPRMPGQPVLVRGAANLVRQLNEPRMQMPDQRIRMLLQQQQQQQPHVQQPRAMIQSRNPLDPYDEMVQRPGGPGGVVRIRPPAPQHDQQEIPESVTAELEQLEQEAGPMEAEAVSAILGELDDDDALLAEMGPDFNILEYVDTDAGPGDKTNLLDNLDLDDEDKKLRIKVEASGKQQPHEMVVPQVPESTLMSGNTSAPAPVTSNPPIYTQNAPRMLPLTGEGPRMPLRMPAQQRVIMGPGGQILSQGMQPNIPMQNNPRMSTMAVAPPPPYPGPPPPYPGPQTPVSQMSAGRLGPAPLKPGPMFPDPLLRRPLLLQEQPLLLEDLLEQEKREQEKQHQGPVEGELEVQGVPSIIPPMTPINPMSAPGVLQGQGMVRPQFPRPPGPYYRPPAPPHAETAAPPPPRTPTFNVPATPPPPLPPDIIATEQDRQLAINYEAWLNHQNQLLQQQLKYYETEVQKLRKIRKSLNSKQRQQRKNGNELNETDAMELQRVTTEQTALQKHLDASRKAVRQHGVLIQEYQAKQQKNRPQGSPLSPMHAAHSPHHSMASGSANFRTSPHPNTPQSPMMSPSPSPLHSPGPGVSASVGAMQLQQQSPISPHSRQPSPRMGTPLSQVGEENPFSPGSLPSPQPQGAGNPRMPSPGLSDPGRIHGMGMSPRFTRGPSPTVSTGYASAGGGPRLVYAAKPGSPQVIQRNLIFQQQQQQQRTQIFQQISQQNPNLTAEQKQKLLVQLSQQHLEQKLQQIQQNPNLTPEQKQQLINQMGMQQQLTPEQRQIAIQQMQQNPNMTLEQKQQLIQQIVQQNPQQQQTQQPQQSILSNEQKKQILHQINTQNPNMPIEQKQQLFLQMVQQQQQHNQALAQQQQNQALAQQQQNQVLVQQQQQNQVLVQQQQQQQNQVLVQQQQQQQNQVLVQQQQQQNQTLVQQQQNQGIMQQQQNQGLVQQQQNQNQSMQQQQVLLQQQQGGEQKQQMIQQQIVQIHEPKPQVTQINQMPLTIEQRQQMMMQVQQNPNISAEQKQHLLQQISQQGQIQMTSEQKQQILQQQMAQQQQQHAQQMNVNIVGEPKQQVMIPQTINMGIQQKQQLLLQQQTNSNTLEQKTQILSTGQGMMQQVILTQQSQQGLTMEQKQTIVAQQLTLDQKQQMVQQGQAAAAEQKQQLLQQISQQGQGMTPEQKQKLMQLQLHQQKLQQIHQRQQQLLDQHMLQQQQELAAQNQQRLMAQPRTPEQDGNGPGSVGSVGHSGPGSVGPSGPGSVGPSGPNSVGPAPSPAPSPGGGGGSRNAPIPWFTFPLPGLRGGAPVWPIGKGKRPPPKRPEDEPSSSRQVSVLRQREDGFINLLQLPQQPPQPGQQKQHMIIQLGQNQNNPQAQRSSLVCVDYDSMDETPPVSPSKQDVTTGTAKEDEKPEEIRLATDAEGIELLAQENLLNLQLEAEDGNDDRRVIIIDNSPESEKSGVMEFVDEDLMVYEPIEDGEELVVLEECEVLEGEFDISNCDVMEIESMEEEEDSTPAPPASTQVQAEPSEKQQIIVRHTKKGKQIVMVKRGEEGKDQRQVLYKAEKESSNDEDKGDISKDVTPSTMITKSAEIIPQSGSSRSATPTMTTLVPTRSLTPTLLAVGPHSRTPTPTGVVSPSPVVSRAATPTTQNRPSPTPTLTPPPINSQLTRLVGSPVAIRTLPSPSVTPPPARIVTSPSVSSSPIRVLGVPRLVNPLNTSSHIRLTTSNATSPARQGTVVTQARALTSANQGQQTVRLVATQSLSPSTGRVVSLASPSRLIATTSIAGSPRFSQSMGGIQPIYRPVANTPLISSPQKTNQLAPRTGLVQTPVITPSPSAVTSSANLPSTTIAPVSSQNIISVAPVESGQLKHASLAEMLQQSDNKPSTINLNIPKKDDLKPVIPTLSFPDFPEGLASKFMSAECSVIKKPDLTESTPIRAAKTYEKSRHGKPKTSLSEHDYTTTAQKPAPKMDIDEADITSHIAKIDPKVRDIISISKITQDVKKIDRRKSMETLSKRKGIDERRRSSENKRELEQRRLMILEEIKQDKQASADITNPTATTDPTVALRPVGTNTITGFGSSEQACSASELKNDHDLSEVIDILENIDSTAPTRLLSSSELQSIEKTPLFENDELEKSPTKPKVDEKINIQSILSESGQSDLQMSDLARGPSKTINKPEPRSSQVMPPANNTSKLAALLTGGKVPTLESLLEKEEEHKKIDEPMVIDSKPEPNLLLSPTSGIMRNSANVVVPSPSTPIQQVHEKSHTELIKESSQQSTPPPQFEPQKSVASMTFGRTTPQTVLPVTAPSMQLGQQTIPVHQNIISQQMQLQQQSSQPSLQPQQLLQQQQSPTPPLPKHVPSPVVQQQQQFTFQVAQQPAIFQEQFQQHMMQTTQMNTVKATIQDMPQHLSTPMSVQTAMGQPPRFQLVATNHLQRLSVPSVVMSTSVHPSRLDESQNVLLKQLLQNTGCAGGASSPGLPRSPTPSTPSPITSPTIKKEPIEPSEMKIESAEELKKLKRRQYQQKRRQSQGKEVGAPKKRARKGSRMEEDYESFSEGLMSQLKQLPPLAVMEPTLPRNYGVCPVFGSGEGPLPSDDVYSTKPFGDCEKPPPSSPVTTQRGFYDQEFSCLQLWTDTDERRLEVLLGSRGERDTDTPDTVVSSSSPECVRPDSPMRFPALQIIKEESEFELFSRCSPTIPLIVPIPIRPRPSSAVTGAPTKLFSDDFKENKENSAPSNVRVTLTLNSDAARDVLSVLKDLANLLHIPPPTTYQIVERTTTPPSIKLGLYRNRGKDGKEGAPVDIQSILNGQAKFCKHCDVVILGGAIRKKVREVPFLAKREDLDNVEELFFCSSNCYMQFSLMHKSPNEGVDRPGSVVDHVGTKAGSSDSSAVDQASDSKPFKGNRYKLWQPGCLQPPTRYKKPTERELMDMLFRVGVTLIPSQNTDDTRRCLFCHQVGDGVPDGPARLLNFDVDKWVHLNCALWSDDVYERVNGALMNVDNALQQGQSTSCALCGQMGATLHCFKVRCSNVYHLSCAVKDECVFFKNKTTYCPAHVPKNDKDNELTTLSVYRRVYVQRDEERQVATMMHNAELNHLMRVGSLIFLSVGQLLPHQLPVFHNSNYIYPVGYKIVRFYWSMRRVNKRCQYVCSIHDSGNRPEFRILVQEPNYEDLEIRDSSAKAAWLRILEPMQQLRREHGVVHLFPRYVSGEDLFGLSEPAVVRVLESLPGVETLSDYKFKYGRNPLLELPLAVNPSGCARAEPRLKNLAPYKRPHTQRTGTGARTNLFSPSLPGEAVCPYSKQFVHSKSSQYKKMKLEWRNNVYLARSKIQGLGLYAARDLERHTMVIEYIGEIIRHELSESREKQYEARNRGIYMFRLDEERVVDATISGGLARYINHSCNPNCVTEIVEVDRELRIIIFAKRRITRGEELAYDYKFDIEDDQHKIPCLCGAPNCRKWMN